MADSYGHQVCTPESSPRSDNESGGGHFSNQDSSIKEQDRFLPIANVSRIMKKALPANAKISKDAKETVQECVSEFISFITGEASDKCQREKRKTINGDDLLWAMSTLGFEEYVEPLKLYLHKYRETEEEKASMAKQGDQTTAKEGSSGMNGNMISGMNCSVNGSMQMMQHYQPQPGMMYTQQQVMGNPYQMSMQSGTQPREMLFGGSKPPWVEVGSYRDIAWVNRCFPLPSNRALKPSSTVEVP
jgi:nuclear transcription Y subunit beta